jgi:ABC-type sugar transport system substrate-binding protein
VRRALASRPRSPWRVGARWAQRRWVVAFANATESPASRWKAPGSPGRGRESFDLAVRQHPDRPVFYDNRSDDARAVANAEAAIARKVDLYIQYHRGAAANATVAQKLKAAGIPVLAVNYPVPGRALYSWTTTAAGRLAGEALAEFAARSWPGSRSSPSSSAACDAADRVPERVQGVDRDAPQAPARRAR